MDRALLPVALVALTLLASAGTVATVPRSRPAAQSGPVPTNGIEMLGLDGPTRSTVATASLDVSTALAIGHVETTAELRRRTLTRQFDGAGDATARRQVLTEAASTVESSIARLRADQRAARTAYVNGTIGPDEYLRRQAIAGARADQLQRELGTIGDLADQLQGVSMRSRLETLRVALTGAGGPVTAQVRAAFTGASDPVTAYVSASADGRALATVQGNQYVREAYRGDLWTPAVTGGIGFDDAIARTGDLYPVAFNSSRNLGRGVAEHGAGTYEISMQVREGTIVTYLDASTEDVFFEVRHFGLSTIDTGQPVVAIDNGTRLVVNRTVEGGPLRIAVSENGTGSTEAVPVTVGGTSYRSGPDGVVWTVAPSGTTRITATGGAGNVSTVIDPDPPTLVDVGSAGQ